MRIDVISIFPEYFAPLELSLIGKARAGDVLSVQVHQLRDFTFDRHHTVDDTPCGGGAGMVMTPEPWALALQHVVSEGPAGVTPLIVFPGPSGRVHTQRHAHELAAEPWLIFACGRYEGIDERVYSFAATLGRVRIVSLGDYVLNGGEVAVLAMVESLARLLPGVVGNAESLVEESHEGGLLEYPVYTKPAQWRGQEVPDVLMSGHHARIAEWRRQQRVERTARRRPDLWTSFVATGEATPADLTTGESAKDLPQDPWV